MKVGNTSNLVWSNYIDNMNQVNKLKTSELQTARERFDQEISKAEFSLRATEQKIAKTSKDLQAAQKQLAEVSKPIEPPSFPLSPCLNLTAS